MCSSDAGLRCAGQHRSVLIVSMLSVDDGSAWNVAQNYGGGGGGDSGLGSGLIGGIWSGLGQSVGAQNQNIWNASWGNQQNAWAANMANTTYQRTMADMRAAGLNPILGMSGGGANSNPTPSPQGTAQNTMSGAVSSAQQAIQMAMNLKEIDSKVKLNDATRGLQAAQSEQALTSAAVNNASLPLKQAEGDIGKIVTPGIQKVRDFIKGAVNNSSKTGFWDDIAEKYGNFMYGKKGGR